jgi:membrane protease YdiL (CAAX protease family)
MNAATRQTLIVVAVVAVAMASLWTRTLVPAVPVGVARWIFPTAAVALPLAVAWPCGLDRMSWRGVGLALAGSLAMPIAFVVEGGRPGLPDGDALLRGVLAAAVAEEVLFRGYAFSTLVRRAGWPLVPAMVVTALVFGLGHVPGALRTGEWGQVLGAAALTGVGGAWYAWLLHRWGYALWVPIAMHASMNLWWQVFAVGPTAASGGAAAVWGRAVTIAVVTVVTLRATGAGETPAPPVRAGETPAPPV